MNFPFPPQPLAQNNLPLGRTNAMMETGRRGHNICHTGIHSSLYFDQNMLYKVANMS